MLKDPRWDKEPSLAGFALFVASKHPNERYQWKNCQVCAVGQYLKSIGRDIPLAQWDGDLFIANKLAQGNVRAALMDDTSSEWTFGRLADRILAYQMA